MASLIYQPNSDTIPSIKIQPQSLPAPGLCSNGAVLISASARQKLLISYVL